MGDGQSGEGGGKGWTKPVIDSHEWGQGLGQWLVFLQTFLCLQTGCFLVQSCQARRGSQDH